MSVRAIELASDSLPPPIPIRRRAKRAEPVSLPMLHKDMTDLSRMYWDVQATRIATGNRRDAMARDMKEQGRDDLIEVFTQPLQVAVDYLETTEHDLQLRMRSLARQHPMAPFVEGVRGMDLPSLSALLAVTGPLSNFPNPAKLWAFCGMSVTGEGTAPHRQAGERARWSPRGRVLCYQWGESIVKAGGPYRELYDRKKAEYLARERTGPSNCPFGQTHKKRDGTVIVCALGHAHMAAKRYAVKRLLRDLWKAWPEYVPE
jgi:hypothetical protein